MTFPDLSEVSYGEFRALRWMFEISGPLVCEGTHVWSLRQKPTFSITRNTVEALARHGFIRRVHVQEAEECDNFELTPFGQEFIRQNRAYFEHLLDDKIKESIGE